MAAAGLDARRRNIIMPPQSDLSKRLGIDSESSSRIIIFKIESSCVRVVSTTVPANQIENVAVASRLSSKRKALCHHDCACRAARNGVAGEKVEGAKAYGKL